MEDDDYSYFKYPPIPLPPPPPPPSTSQRHVVAGPGVNSARATAGRHSNPEFGSSTVRPAIYALERTTSAAAEPVYARTEVLVGRTAAPVPGSSSVVSASSSSRGGRYYEEEGSIGSEVVYVYREPPKARRASVDAGNVRREYSRGGRDEWGYR